MHKQRTHVHTLHAALCSTATPNAPNPASYQLRLPLQALTALNSTTCQTTTTTRDEPRLNKSSWPFCTTRCMHWQQRTSNVPAAISPSMPYGPHLPNPIQRLLLLLASRRGGLATGLALPRRGGDPLPPLTPAGDLLSLRRGGLRRSLSSGESRRRRGGLSSERRRRGGLASRSRRGL